MRLPALLLTSTLAAVAAADLAPGDIAVIGMYCDSPDKVALVALVDVASGTTINITDNGWKQSGKFASGENVVSWSAPTAGVKAGTVIALAMDGLSNSGDQVIAYTGTLTTPKVLFAVNNDGSAWQSDSTSTSTSALPTGLVNGTTAVALSEKDNYAYTGPTSGTKAALLASIADKSKWTGNDSSQPSWPAAFTVTDAGSSGGGSGGGTTIPGTATYKQTADGSAGVFVGANHFLNFDDETDIARLYLAGSGTAPVKTFNLTSALALTAEADFEDAAKIGNDVFLISSHGRNKNGVYETDRYRFARLALGGSGATTTVSVAGYTKNLVQGLVTTSNWTTPDSAVISLIAARSQLSKGTVANLAPKVDGLNIEGLCQLPGATTRLAIGLRNPLINNNAIVVTLENPVETAAGSTPRFGQAIQMNLNGLGVRGMAWFASANCAYLIAGHTTADAGFALYRWSGLPSDAPVYVRALSHSSGGSIEAVLPHEGTSFLRLLVDEGSVLINGVENKSQPTASQIFHDLVIDLSLPVAGG